MLTSNICMHVCLCNRMYAHAQARMLTLAALHSSMLQLWSGSRALKFGSPAWSHYTMLKFRSPTWPHYIMHAGHAERPLWASGFAIPCQHPSERPLLPRSSGEVAQSLCGSSQTDLGLLVSKTAAMCSCICWMGDSPVAGWMTLQWLDG